MLNPNALVFKIIRKLHLNFEFLTPIKKFIMSFNLINANHKFLKDYCKGSVIDIGANVGDYSKYFIKHGAKKIYAFEPTEETFEILRRRLRKSDVCFRVALGEHNRTITFYTDGISGINSAVPQEGFQKTIIPVRKLDDFNFNDVSLIKIDAEGMDYEVLSGAVETIKKHKPAIMVEIRADLLKVRGYSENHIHNLMNYLGYSGKKIPYCYESEHYDYFYEIK